MVGPPQVHKKVTETSHCSSDLFSGGANLIAISHGKSQHHDPSCSARATEQNCTEPRAQQGPGVGLSPPSRQCCHCKQPSTQQRRSILPSGKLLSTTRSLPILSLYVVSSNFPPARSEVSWGLQHIQKQPRAHHQAKHLSGFLNNPVPTAAPPVTAPKLHLLSQCLCDSSHILLSLVLAFPYFFFFFEQQKKKLALFTLYIYSKRKLSIRTINGNPGVLDVIRK